MNRPQPIVQPLTLVSTVVFTTAVSLLNPLSSRTSQAASFEDSPKAVLDEAGRL